MDNGNKKYRIPDGFYRYINEELSDITALKYGGGSSRMDTDRAIKLLSIADRRRQKEIIDAMRQEITLVLNMQKELLDKVEKLIDQ